MSTFFRSATLANKRGSHDGYRNTQTVKVPRFQAHPSHIQFSTNVMGSESSSPTLLLRRMTPS